MKTGDDGSYDPLDPDPREDQGKVPAGFYHTLVKNTGDTVWVVCRDQKRVTFINRDFSGVRKESVVEHGFSAIWPVLTIESLQPLLDAFERAVMKGERTDNLRTTHRNAVTGEEEHYINSIIPIHDSAGRVSHIQVCSRDESEIIKAQRTIDILNSVSAAIQSSLLGTNIFEVVGSRFKKHGIRIIISIIDESETAKLEYSNFPRRKLKKAISHLKNERNLSGLSTSLEHQLKSIAKKTRGQFFDDPHYYVKSRFPYLGSGKNVMTIVDLLELKKIIVAPLRVNREIIGGFLMTSDFLSEMDLTAVKAFAMQFSHAITYSRLHADSAMMRDLLSSTLQKTRDSIFATDGSGSIALWNRASMKLFGYRNLDIIGENVSVLGIDGQLFEELQRAAGGDMTVERKGVRLIARDGSTREVSLICSGLEAGAGVDPGLIFTVAEL